MDINDKNNYNDNFNCNIEIAFFKYTTLIEEFLSYSNKITNYKYILIKGIEIIYHTFNLLLLHSKNIDLTYHNTQKSYLYYYEFMEQIKDENNSLLNLNVKDATMFIYKKIIYNINTEYTSTSEIEQINLLTLDKIIMFYNNILYNSITNDDNIEVINKNIVKSIFKSNFKDIISHIDTIMICNELTLIKITSTDKVIQLYKLIIKYVKKNQLRSPNTIDIENINSTSNNKIIKKLFKLNE
tara:strand:+ start:688 stop:1410 length:723 start_codon:yes stop_codon:yes gene_type:complete